MDTHQSPLYRVEVLKGRVARGALNVAMPERELETIAFLAMHDAPADLATLGAALYPDVEAARSANSLKVFMHRARRRTFAGLILHGPDGYRLGEDVDVDVRDVVAAVRKLSCRLSTLNEFESERLEVLAARLRAPRPGRLVRWPWFAPYDANLTRTGADVCSMMAWEALRSHRYNEALRLARTRLDEDPCDERAREIAIHAYAALGQPAAAIAEFQHYSDLLAKELGAEPAIELQRIFREACTHPAQTMPVWESAV
jgi:DNA-binding SARP family transcriptional activator